MRYAKNAFGARQSYRCAVSRQHHERGPWAGADCRVRLFGPAIARLLDDNHAMAMYLAQPGPGSVSELALRRKSAGLPGVGKVTCAAAPRTHLRGPGQRDCPGAPRRGPVGARGGAT